MQNIFITLLSLITIAVSTSKYDNIYQTTSNYENQEPQYEFVPYGFGYEIVDEFGNKNWRREQSLSENQVVGSYGIQDSNGINRQVEYTADKNGFRAQIKTTGPESAQKNPTDVSIDANPVQVSEENYEQLQQRLSSNQNNYQISELNSYPIYGEEY